MERCGKGFSIEIGSDAENWVLWYLHTYTHIIYTLFHFPAFHPPSPSITSIRVNWSAILPDKSLDLLSNQLSHLTDYEYNPIILLRLYSTLSLSLSLFLPRIVITAITLSLAIYYPNLSLYSQISHLPINFFFSPLFCINNKSYYDQALPIILSIFIVIIVIVMNLSVHR